jgi:hypothetical protein
MKQKLLILLLGTITLILGLVSCKKKTEAAMPPANSELAFDNAPKNFFVLSTSPGDVFKIPVGITTPLDHPVTVQFSYTSATAIAGTHYSAPASITIPAGKVIDTLQLKGFFSNIPAGVAHNLTVKISGGDLPALVGKDSVLVTLRRYCNVVLSSLLGAYPNTNEFFGSPYGPYSTSVLTATPVSGSSTKATVTIANIYDAGWNPITFELDWTDPANFKATVVSQSSGIGDAGTLNPAYTGMQVAVRPFAGQQGTFDMCNQVLTLRLQLGVAGLGWFSGLYTVTMKRS